MIKAVVLAGGSGTRLWPLSRAAQPKQFSARCSFATAAVVRSLGRKIARPMQSQFIRSLKAQIQVNSKLEQMCSCVNRKSIVYSFQIVLALCQS